ncbi:MAG: hypothetical protein CFE39_03455 [Comamonadaceae bacterium PBBC2]|nr:MAG: hypothetical protein CFE39_03455 [Comamonadaceae bacterium PBBC2]
MRLHHTLLLALGLLLSALSHAADPTAPTYRFAFGNGPVAPGFTAVQPDMAYSRERGYGFEAGAHTTLLPAQGGQALSSNKPFYFSVAVPEGNYRTSITFGGTAQASDTTVRAELRRLMLEGIRTEPGTSSVRSFTVNVRTPRIQAGPKLAAGAVLLKAPRETVEEAWAWDGRLTLEINGSLPVIQRIEIVAVEVPTLFVLGDSTVGDQSQEPYSSWGQMLPRFFKPSIAVANHGESGETYRDSIARRRLDKILSVLKPGDTVLMQFGHNDQKQIRQGIGDVNTYRAEIKTHVESVRAYGGVPVIASPMERRGFDDAGKVKPSLIDYADAARQVAAELKVPFIDLNAQSKLLYEALGPDASKLAFAEPAPGKIDNTHHNNYGSYALAKLIVAGLRQAQLPIASHIADDFITLDPTRPDAPAQFKLPPSPNFTHQRPLGDEDPAGFSGERLQRLDNAIESEIRQGQLAGGIMVITRDGKPVHFKTYGHQDMENQRPMQPDAIFRIASMSKALTSVAVMMLYEEGKFLLKDPVAKFIPAFANPVVAIAPPAGSPAGTPATTEKAKRPISIRDLLRHTAGLSYGAGPAAEFYKQAGFTDWYLIGHKESIEQVVNRLAALPLQGHPGEQFQYGYATDVLGRLVEVVSGMPLDKFIETRITRPLGMVDTSFFLPPEKISRLANVYGFENGRLQLKETAATSDFVHGPRQCLSGGAGLLSTAADYTRFLQMLLNGGELEGQRLLSPKTVELMRSNQVGDKYRGDADGFGLGFWVNVDQGVVGEIGSVGAFGWGSAYFPQYVVDPKERMIVLFMTQHRPAGNSNLNHRVKVLSYQALVQ